jgi:hypothetical protein
MEPNEVRRPANGDRYRAIVENSRRSATVPPAAYKQATNRRLAESQRLSYARQAAAKAEADVARKAAQVEQMCIYNEKKKVRNEITRLTREADWQIHGGAWGTTNTELKRIFGPRDELSLGELERCLEYCRRQWGHLIPAGTTT